MTCDITITGNVGKTVQWREIEGGGGRTTFDVASTHRFQRNKEEWVDGATTWYRVTCWSRLAEHVRDSLRKGDAVVVHGRLTFSRWVDANGAKREDCELKATWVGHDLRRGTAAFTRSRLRPEPPEPDGSDEEVDYLDAVDLRALEAAEETEEAREAEPSYV